MSGKSSLEFVGKMSLYSLPGAGLRGVRIGEAKIGENMAFSGGFHLLFESLGLWGTCYVGERWGYVGDADAIWGIAVVVELEWWRVRYV